MRSTTYSLSEESNWIHFRPTQLETRDFVNYLLTATDQESKALSPSRKAALTKVLAYNEAPGEPYFPGIDPHVFAFQLALRIRSLH